MWRMRTSLGSGDEPRAHGHLAELVDLSGEDPQPAPHALEVAELPLHRIDDGGRPLQRPGVAGLAELVDPVADPHQPDRARDGEQRACPTREDRRPPPNGWPALAGRGAGPATTDHEADDRSADQRHREEPDDRPADERAHVVLGRGPQVALDVVLAGQPLERRHVELLDRGPQLERRGVAVDDDPAEGRDAEHGVAGQARPDDDVHPGRPHAPPGVHEGHEHERPRPRPRPWRGPASCGGGVGVGVAAPSASLSMTVPVMVAEACRSARAGLRHVR